MEYQKVKSVAKVVKPKGKELNQTVLATMKTISDLVGATLGPGGRSVLIERHEHDLPAMITKDGVTCFRSLGFTDPTKQVIMEAARDASVRTASEAGDGTTTATVLAEAFVRNINDYCLEFPKESPQKVVRFLENEFKTTIETLVKDISLDLGEAENPTDYLKAVAKTSANGDSELAEAVIDCFNITGDEGNVTITEEPGHSAYVVEEVKGYGVEGGYETSCGKLWAKFVNDPASNRCVLPKPVFIVYNGKLTELQTAQLLLERIGSAWGNGFYRHHNIVLVANGFSESVLGELAINFCQANTINVYPLTAPMSVVTASQYEFLADVCAITGARMFDPLNNPLDQGDFSDLGPSVDSFEAGRYRSNIVGNASGPVWVGFEGAKPEVDESVTYEALLLTRIDHLKERMKQAPSKLDKMFLEERVAKLSGGIARLKVVGASNGETKEKRDRAEDAVCAVRGAVKHGVLAAGGFALASIIQHYEGLELDTHSRSIFEKVLKPSLRAPIERLLLNAGLNQDEITDIIEKLYLNAKSNSPVIYDASNHNWVSAYEAGLYDSTPAVLEAIRNSISIAGLLGTLGGTVVFARDFDLERSEARDTQDFIRNANVNEANERA